MRLFMDNLTSKSECQLSLGGIIEEIYVLKRATTY